MPQCSICHTMYSSDHGCPVCIQGPLAQRYPNERRRIQWVFDHLNNCSIGDIEEILQTLTYALAPGESETLQRERVVRLEERRTRFASGYGRRFNPGFRSFGDYAEVERRVLNAECRRIRVLNPDNSFKVGDRVRIDTNILGTVMEIGNPTYTVIVEIDEDLPVNPILEEVADNNGLNVDFSGEREPKRYRGAPPGFWKVKDGSFIKISEMGENHINNVMRRLEARFRERARNLRAYRELVTELNRRKDLPKGPVKRRIR